MYESHVFSNPVTYIIAKQSADSIIDSNYKNPMDCGKLHATHDVKILLP